MGINEELAVERTRLANWRTLLAYIRTGISFIALGAAIFHFLRSIVWTIVGTGSVAMGAFVITAGFISYKKFNKKINDASKTEKPESL